MIRIYREDNKVCIKFTVDLGQAGEWNYFFSNSRSNSAEAELISREFRKQLEDKVESARREAYNDGWKDAKAKRMKRDWFSINI